MVRATEFVVDILRRGGPGTLSADHLRMALRRCRPAIVLTMERLRLLVEESQERLMMLEVPTDQLGEDDGAMPLDSWVILLAPEDSPSREGLANALWQSLAALAADVDPTSRVSVSRWVLMAEHALRICHAGSRS